MAEPAGEDPLHIGSWPQTAAEMRARFHPGSGASAMATNAWAEFDPAFAALVNNMALAAGYAGEELDLRTRALCTVAALVAAGEQRYARNWMGNALNVGATPAELVSLLRQLFVYVGTPRTVQGFEALKGAIEDRSAR